MINDYDPNTVHKITRGQMEHIYKCLRFIDTARKALEKKGAGNEGIIDELQKCSDGIYGVVKDLPVA